jgi:hypothetical protein
MPGSHLQFVRTLDFGVLDGLGMRAAAEIRAAEDALIAFTEQQAKRDGRSWAVPSTRCRNRADKALESLNSRSVGGAPTPEGQTELGKWHAYGTRLRASCRNCL